MGWLQSLLTQCKPPPLQILSIGAELGGKLKKIKAKALKSKDKIKTLHSSPI